MAKLEIENNVILFSLPSVDGETHSSTLTPVSLRCAKSRSGQKPIMRAKSLYSLDFVQQTGESFPESRILELIARGN